MVRHDSGAFLTRISDALVELGPGGINLTSLTLASPHQATFTQPEHQTALRPLTAIEAFPLAEPPSGSWFVSHEQHRQTFWQPASTAPAYLHFAWLLNELGEELSTLEAAGLTLLRAEALQAESVDLILAYRPAEPSAEARPETPGEDGSDTARRTRPLNLASSKICPEPAPSSRTAFGSNCKTGRSHSNSPSCSCGSCSKNTATRSG